MKIPRIYQLMKDSIKNIGLTNKKIKNRMIALNKNRMIKDTNHSRNQCY